jgi:hypothetical protein
MGHSNECPYDLWCLVCQRTTQEKLDTIKTIFSVIGVFLASFAIVWFLRRSAAATYHRIGNATSVNMKARIGGLVLRALLDMLFMFIFAIVTLVLFFIFMDRAGPSIFTDR